MPPSIKVADPKKPTLFIRYFSNPAARLTPPIIAREVAVIMSNIRPMPSKFGAKMKQNGII